MFAMLSLLCLFFLLLSDEKQPQPRRFALSPHSASLSVDFKSPPSYLQISLLLRFIPVCASL